jgi:hypothetical protein
MAGERESLRIEHLKARTHPGPTRLLNMKVPSGTAQAIDQLAKQLKTSKTEVVLALLNEGLAIAKERIR